MLTSGWRHTVRPDLLCRDGTNRPPMKKGTTLFRGSALVTTKFSLSDYRALACSTPLISVKLFSYVPQSISPTLNNAEIVPSALP